jgi:hypothetical protein
MAVPYTFGAATSAIPLSQLDSNFNTAITIGNTAVQLGNTVTTLNNMTLANVTIASGNVTLTNVTVTTANVTTANITTAVILNDNVTNLTATSANITTANITTDNITTANITTANIGTDNITNGTVSGSLTLSGGTANGVTYLNGSKVVTSGSALTYSGTTLTAPTLNLTNALGTAYGGTGLTSFTANGVVYASSTSALATGSALTFDGTNLFVGGTTGAFGGTQKGFAAESGTVIAVLNGESANSVGSVGTVSNHDFSFKAYGSEQMRLTSTGLGIGTSSPTGKLHIASGAGLNSYFNSTASGIYLQIANNGTNLGYLGDGGSLVSGGSNTDFAIRSQAALKFSVNGNATAVTIDSSGNVGIGTTSPGSLLNLSKSASSAIGPEIRLQNGYGNISAGGQVTFYTDAATAYIKGQVIYSNSSSGNALVFGTASSNTTGTDRMTLDQSGNLGLGVTPSAWGQSGTLQAIQIKNTSLAGSGANAYWGSNWYGGGFDKYITTAAASLVVQTGGQHIWYNAPSGTAGNAITFTQAMTLDASGTLVIGATTGTSGSKLDVNGVIMASNGSAANPSITSRGESNAGLFFGDNGVASYLGFSAGGIEGGRFDPSGNLLVNTTSGYTGKMRVNNASADGIGVQLTGSGGGAYIAYVSNTNQNYAYWVYNGSATGSISTNGTTTSYNVTSDQRLKENIVDAPEFGSVIDSLKVRSFDWKTDGNHQRAGFIAQELVTVAPEAVHQPVDPEEMMAVDYSKLVPMLVKEIQDLRKRLAAAGI